MSGHWHTKQTLHISRIKLGTGSAGRLKSHKAHSEVVQCPKLVPSNPECIRTCLHLYSTPKNCHSVMEKALSREKIKREQWEEQKHLWNLHHRLSLIPSSIFPKSRNWQKWCPGRKYTIAFFCERVVSPLHLSTFCLLPGRVIETRGLTVRRTKKRLMEKASHRLKHDLSSAIWITFTLGGYCRLKHLLK